MEERKISQNINEQTTEKEKNLLRLIHDMKFGELHIYVADGQPVRVEEIVKSVKL